MRSQKHSSKTFPSKFNEIKFRTQLMNWLTAKLKTMAMKHILI